MRLVLAALLTAFAIQAHADSNWRVPPPRLAQYTHFTNLQDGASIETPFVLKFGLTGMGLAPITKAQDRTGHHHLLINRELPLDFSKPLPFNDQYIHFGKGQMETVLKLKPGKYTLRLVLADNHHVPDFVYSKPLRITVTKFHAEVNPDTLSTPGVQILLPKAEATLNEPLQVEFHASKANVSHIALKEPGTGHFRLTVAGDHGSQVMDMTGGETEAWIAPPRGNYQLKLDFMDNLNAGKVLYSAAPAAITVK
jgi:hypothetical protein